MRTISVSRRRSSFLEEAGMAYILGTPRGCLVRETRLVGGRNDRPFLDGRSQR